MWICNQSIPHLEAMIASDPDTLVRLHGAEALWIITKNKKVVPGFIEALSDEDVEVRRFAISMIGLMEADLQDVMQPLIAALADSNPFVRGTAAMVLGGHGPNKPPRYYHILSGSWQDEEFMRVIAVHAILCIESVKDRRTRTDLGRGVEKRRQNGSSTCCSGTWATFRPLVLWRFNRWSRLLVMTMNTVRLTVLNTLNNIGTAAAPATPVLVRILADSDDIIERGIAASVLGSIGPAAEEAVPQLLTCLQEPGDSAARVYFRLKMADALVADLGSSRTPSGNRTRSGEKS